MPPRRWLLVWALALAAALGFGVVAWQRARTLRPAALAGRLPRRDALILSVDFAALRRAGLLGSLGGSKVAEDPEYRKFVDATRFDYRRDLNAAVAAFAPNGNYLLINGSFDWGKLETYVRSQGGACEKEFCRMTGSAPERRISFFPMRRNVMALAVSPDDSAALRLKEPAAALDETPDAPVWLSVPAAALKSAESLPQGTRQFAGALAQADALTLALAPASQRLEARLEIRCRDAADAVRVAAQLTETTSILRDAILREGHQPNPAELSGVLASGSFRSEGTRARGSWPIERVFLESLLGGQE